MLKMFIIIPMFFLFFLKLPENNSNKNVKILVFIPHVLKTFEIRTTNLPTVFHGCGTWSLISKDKS